MKKLLILIAVLGAFLAMAAPANAALQIWAAGDIGEQTYSPTSPQEQTADIILSNAPNYVFMLGDGAYDVATKGQYDSLYDPAWGSRGTAADFFSITRPVPGNHEYLDTSGLPTNQAQGYRDYFNESGGPNTTCTPTPCVPTTGPLYYSFTAGGWLFVFLDSEDALNGGSTPSAQYTYLKNLLNANTQPCVAVSFHRPRWVSDTSVNNYGAAGAIWTLMYNKHVDLVFNGHAHLYERFKKLNATATAEDATAGIREVVVGTGGAAEHTYDTTNSLDPLIDFHNDSQYGVLKFTAGAGTYGLKYFVPNGTGGGTALDAGVTGQACNTK